jgi:hypothetical protein
MGQCFSTTVQTALVAPREQVLIPDVERNGFTFSDGVGEISRELLDEVLRGVPFGAARTSPNDVSAIQVRSDRMHPLRA